MHDLTVLYVEPDYVLDGYTQSSITIDWVAKNIFVPKFYLTQLGPTSYLLDTATFKLDVNELMAEVDGMIYPDPIKHNSVVVLSGISYARVVEIINGYTITFEDGQYYVSLDGSNNNIADVKTLNQVSLIPNNAAGLVIVEVEKTLAEAEKAAIATAVWNHTQ